MLKKIPEAMKKLTFTGIVAIALAAVMMFEAPVQSLADASPKYIENMIMVSADSTDAAKAKLPEGYALVNDPIYEGQDIEKGTMVRTYLAYKPTLNRDEAIVDIQAMHMCGGYGYEEYRAFLDNQKALSEQLVGGLKDAVKEFRKNLKVGKTGAQYAEKALSFYVDDDYANDPKYGAPRSIADIFKDETTEDSVFVKIVMESNMEILGAIERLLAIACSDTASETIFEYLNDPYFTFSEDAVEAGAYNTYATDIINSLEDVQTSIRYFESFFTEDIYDVFAEYDSQSGQISALMKAVNIDYDEAVADLKWKFTQTPLGQNAFNLRDALDNRLDKQQVINFDIGRTLFILLNDTSYEGVESKGIYCLYDLIMQHPINNGTGKEKYRLADFYPLISVMTAGQRGMLKVGLSEIFLSQTFDKDNLMKYMSVMTDDKEGLIKPSDKVSIYMGVDRSVFTPEGIAMTSAAITRAKNKGDYSYGRADVDPKVAEIATSVAMISGAVALAETLTWVGMALGVRYGGLFATAISEANLTFYVSGSASVISGLTSANGAALSGIAQVINTSSVPFVQYMEACLLSVVGKAVAIVTAVALAVLIIAIAVKLIVEFMTKEEDQLYTSIPRILLSEETVYTGKLDDKGNKDTASGYAYYYGVKNLELNENSKDPNGNSLANQVMDVANWSLYGVCREWIALYTCSDHKLCKEPILADSLKVVPQPSSAQGEFTVIFFNDKNCNFEGYYQSMIKNHKDYADKYLVFKRAEPERTNSGSVFSNGSIIAAGAIGLVIGACGGTAITLLAKKKKKED